MPELTITLTDAENADLESVAEGRLQTSEDCAHDLLVSAVADEIAKSPDARARSHTRGVMAARRQASFTDVATTTLKRLNESGYPTRERRNL